ncbi:hypothetical protein CUU66_12775 [Peribacillus deserti]|uniref:Uncharacterized protein n=1 Tax=Peribacillus deserti TaxID=673318 RepID=A0A2N5M539_9BACI|nr:hypothetical protein CUU66_12775 [Peribacillus deserti]
MISRECFFESFEAAFLVLWVSSKNKTVKTTAGTFKCIEVKDQDGYTNFYAKGVGLVKTYNNGKVLTELVGLNKR